MPSEVDTFLRLRPENGRGVFLVKFLLCSESNHSKERFSNNMKFPENGRTSTEKLAFPMGKGQKRPLFHAYGKSR